MTADHRNVQGALVSRESSRSADLAIQGGYRTNEFRTTVYGSGITDPFRCDFSFAFVTEPSIATGCSLIEGDAVLGAHPEAHTTVIRWHRDHAGLYLAADVVTRTVGHPRQRLKVRITFSGQAITLPAGSTLRPGSTLDSL